MKNGQLFATIPTIMYLCSTNAEMRWFIPHAKLKDLQRHRFRWDFARTRAIWLPVGSVGKNCKCSPSKIGVQY